MTVSSLERTYWSRLSAEVADRPITAAVPWKSVSNAFRSLSSSTVNVPLRAMEIPMEGAEAPPPAARTETWDRRSAEICHAACSPCSFPAFFVEAS